MQRSRIQKVFQATKKANAILSNAGGIMLRSSLDTAKQIAILYKDAGLKAFGLSKEVVKKTVSLTIDNQKELLKTSGKALKDVAQSIRESELAPKTTPAGKARKNGTPKSLPKGKKEITIDDLL